MKFMTCFAITANPILTQTEAAPKELVGPCTNTTKPGAQLLQPTALSPKKDLGRKGPKHM